MIQTFNTGTPSQADFLNLDKATRAEALLFEGTFIATRRCYGNIVALFSMSSNYSVETWYNYTTKEIDKIEPIGKTYNVSLYKIEVQQIRGNEALLEQQKSHVREIMTKLKTLASNRKKDLSPQDDFKESEKIVLPPRDKKIDNSVEKTSTYLNLELARNDDSTKDRINNCFKTLASDDLFIRETTKDGFRQLFLKGEVTKKALWNGTNAELNFFILGIKMHLTNEAQYKIWVRTQNCFKPKSNKMKFETRSLISPRNTVTKIYRKKILIQAIQDITGKEYTETN